MLIGLPNKLERIENEGNNQNRNTQAIVQINPNQLEGNLNLGF